MEYMMNKKLEKKERYFEEYFFVQFQGKGFPKAFENKKFIVRGR